MKNPVTPSGIDPGTVRLLAQRLNHYGITDPKYIYIYIIQNIESNTNLYLGITIKKYFTTHFTATCFGPFLWSHFQA